MRKLIIASVVVAVLVTPAIAAARAYVIPRHARGYEGQRLYKPRQIELARAYGFEADVQRIAWTRWGSRTAQGRGVIRGTMGMGAVIAHVRLTASRITPLPSCPGLPNPDDQLYRDLRAKFRWKPIPGWNRADRKESKALSGNLAGRSTLQC
jgi:hypothetical protein